MSEARARAVAPPVVMPLLISASLCALAACATQPSASSLPAPRAELAIGAGAILDPRTGTLSAPSVVLVRGGRITRVIRREQFQRDDADSLIDLGDLTLLPGLVDSHVHLTIGGALRTTALADLRAGFTTVVDLGALSFRVLRFRDSVNAGLIPGPRIIAAGMWVGVKGGVCEFTGIGVPGGPDAFRARVRENAEAGADVIKLCISGWPAAAFASPAQYEMSDAAIAASVDEAHRHRLLVVAHDISAGGVRAAVASGIDGLAHAAYLDSSLAESLRAQNVFLIPTLASLTNADSSEPARALVASVELAYRTGVRLVFGTDGGVLPHGRNADELLALVRAGVRPSDAIRAATINAASAWRLASIGIIEPGMDADMIAVAGNPLQDISALRAPRFVMARGRVAVLSR